MKTLLALLVGIAVLTSCKDDSDDPTAVEVDTSVDFVRVDKNGINVFSNASANYIDPSNVETFYLKNGDKVEVNNPDLAASKGVILNEINGNKYLRMFVYPGEVDQEETITYLQWKENDTDTIKSLMSRSPGAVFISKLWINNSLIYEAGKSKGITWNGGLFERLITIQDK
ncbi:hypothetical protein CLV98_105265 [Dyadobacter jejuensis]|uniref:Uncharacterized protein n=1 Tax=Dyadobacter jejuensis TaxID=1082580 RepID=A0A316AJZ9_9BACT|nr:hypothetical protein [Dyadobacter jejuensis]PWJ58083.1 hypothetical protein CLV98_105265 [Dyadobacter jejuensis]